MKIGRKHLLIADLSYWNKNVHHEIGYAQAKGVNSFLLYGIFDSTDDSEKIGSNLSMYAQFSLNTYGKLREGSL